MSIVLDVRIDALLGQRNKINVESRPFVGTGGAEGL
jgi:hypothetical protein